MRARLWRLNLALGLVLACVVHAALTTEQAEQLTVVADAPERLVDTETIPLTPEEGDEFILLIREFHGISSIQDDLSPSSQGATRLPLSAFRVALYVLDQDGPDGVTLVSKDPSHPERYSIFEDRPDRDAKLLGVEQQCKEALFHVARGDERFTFVVSDEAPMRVGSVLTVIPTRTRHPFPSAESMRVSSSAATTLKFLPFYGDDGRVEGVRVTGVKPGSWGERLGLKKNDVITATDDRTELDARTLRSALRTGWEPERLIVRRLESARWREFELNNG